MFVAVACLILAGLAADSSHKLHDSSMAFGCSGVNDLQAKRHLALIFGLTDLLWESDEPSQLSNSVDDLHYPL